MHIEKEKTFLLKSFPPKIFQYPYDEITDIYIPGAQISADLRFRKISNPSATFYQCTKKYPLDPQDISIQKEISFPISTQEFTYLSTYLPKSLVKRRYRYPYKNLTIEIDVFEGALSGLVMADIEYTGENLDLDEMPDFLGAEVSQSVYLSGGYLFGKTYDDIAEILESFGYQKLSLPPDY